ncbi:DUF4430 domain-containing protein [Isoptericola sp. S6320L]|uniref:DUF4430 domain-containing protein n=1 Tax=Isoptericola sp. S6320L TaxID=2926411 RepID=UPI001FF3A692|nr:DUF4430 domain-containing protein [Isoptericola sp. S6320L]MCK0115664.1 DUF4430 domain-containing protein [Isoptericola sp. S6320L]
MKTLMRKTSSRLLAATAAGVLSVGLVAGCSGDDEATPEASAAASSEAEPADDAAAEEVTELSYAGEDGKTALELLVAADPEAVVSGEGEMAYVTAIRGHAAESDTEFWALYVDGEMAQVGAGSLETEDGQQLQWKLEEIE